VHDHEHKHDHHAHEHTHDPGVSSVSIVCKGEMDLEKGVHIIFRGRIMWEPNEPCINKIVFIVNNLKWGRTGETASKIAYSTEGISEKRDSNRWCILQSNQSTT
ncbi:Os02g0774700, partial [Oryza sativa Japonica Group]